MCFQGEVCARLRNGRSLCVAPEYALGLEPGAVLAAPGKMPYVPSALPKPSPTKLPILERAVKSGVTDKELMLAFLKSCWFSSGSLVV